MSMQSEEKKRSGPAMSSQAKITKGDLSEDALLTKSALHGPDNPINAGGRGQDKQGEALVIPEKEDVGEKMINKPGVALKIGLPAAGLKKDYEPIRGKTKAPSGSAAKRIVSMAAKEGREKRQKRTASFLKILLS